MATLYYNGLTQAEDIYTLTEIPNILKVTENIIGTNAQFLFRFVGDLEASVTSDGQYYVTFLGETVTNVMSPNDAKNKRFYIDSDPISTAASFARALRNCSSLASEFNIIHSENNVTLVAKTIGSKWRNIPNYIQRNLPQDGEAYMFTQALDGYAYSNFYGGKIDVDVFAENNYVTTLEKNFYGSECAFDMSSILSTLSDFGKTTPYKFVMSLIGSDGSYSSIGEVNGVSTVGYMANQSEKYLWAKNTKLLINQKRGDDDIELYTYDNTIPISVLCGSEVTAFTLSVSVKDSAFSELYYTSETVRRLNDNLIVDTSVNIDSTYFTDAYYIDITVVGGETIRFNVIKPLKATDYYQRVEWRNEFGGISFFDFTSNRSDTISHEVETYEKNIFDYYDTDSFEKKKIYKNECNKEVTLTTQLMPLEGTYIFNSLIKSRQIWTYINGKKYYIIVNNIEKNEVQENIYEVKITFEYSDNLV